MPGLAAALDIPWDTLLTQGGLAVALALSVAANIWQARDRARVEARCRDHAEATVAVLANVERALERADDVLVALAGRAAL